MAILYPKDDTEWKSYPLGDLMWEAFQKPHNKKPFGSDPKDERNYFETHNRAVYTALERLIDENKYRDVFQDASVVGRDSFHRCLDAFRGVGPADDLPIGPRSYIDHLRRVANLHLFDPIQETFDDLLYAALFHDIGKLIINERHPVVGLHVVADLYPEKRNKLIAELGAARYRNLLTLIRDHDKFGVLSTGEASLPILASVGRYCEADKKDVQKTLAMLFLLTLADIAGSRAARPEGKQDKILIVDEKAHLICKDWAAFNKILEDSDGQRERVLKAAVQLAQTPSATVERIHRLVVDSAKNCPRLSGELSSRSLIEEALEDAFGPHMDKFCAEFALIAKFDYCLYFFRDLMEFCEQGDKEREEKAKGAQEVVEIVIAILRRITDSYRGLTSADRIDPIGVGFEHLRLPDEKAKRDAIVKLLFKSRERALRWLVDEIAGWQVV